MGEQVTQRLDRFVQITVLNLFKPPVFVSLQSSPPADTTRQDAETSKRRIKVEPLRRIPPSTIRKVSIYADTQHWNVELHVKQDSNLVYDR